MEQFCGTASWLLNSLGASLLACSLVLVPTSEALGQEANQCPMGQVECDPYNSKDTCQAPPTNCWGNNCNCTWVLKDPPKVPNDHCECR
jgi:hypothetical protein